MAFSALRYFDEVLAVEIAAINRRRRIHAAQGSAGEDVKQLNVTGAKWRQPVPDSEGVNPAAIDHGRMRPQPIPCTAVGIALSGGGIRSAAVCLGALQALNTYGVIQRTDYLSTVSGGGYIGACMTARMSQRITDPAQPQAPPRTGLFPFGDADIRDNDVVGYIRNYSNYLLPRARSGVVNFLDITAILLRGLLANSVVVLNVIVGAAMLTYANYLAWSSLTNGNYIVRTGWIGLPRILGLQNTLPQWLKTSFTSSAYMACIYAGILVLWALIRSLSRKAGNDANSPALAVARILLGLLSVSIFLDLQPLCIYGLAYVLTYHAPLSAFISSPAVAGAITIAVFARRLGAFLETTRVPSAQVTSKSRLWALRIATKITLFAAGMVLPLVLLVVYWLLTAWLFADNQLPKWLNLHFSFWTYLWFFLATLLCAFIFTGNAYSLHQFYKDRLTRAFVFKPANANSDQTAWPNFKLSQIRTDDCPYHIINAALNVQGSAEANRRGRNADFFTFTKHFVGSDLTHFAATKSTGASPAAAHDMEAIDPQLDVGSTIAISGAALSANMGSNTVRWLSPTLALLNIRLGYWLRNPRALIAPKHFGLKTFVLDRVDEFFLLLEMLNVLDEKRAYVYLSDGGHIENLGIYQLLKRGCRLIIAIDAEADPAISCASLLKLERYARIDLGIRIVLPWERIARRNAEIDCAIDPRTTQEAQRHRGPHCALGPIIYPDDSRGMLLYFKSSLSGDEKDYVLDYKKRNMDFPHETTGDQFFTEEQFEVYRSLGYHIVDGYFSGTDGVSCQTEGPAGWPTEARAKEEVAEALGLAQQIRAAAAAQ